MNVEINNICGKLALLDGDDEGTYTESWRRKAMLLSAKVLPLQSFDRLEWYHIIDLR